MDAYTCILCVHMSTYVLGREVLEQQEVFSHWIWVLRLSYSGPPQDQSILTSELYISRSLITILILQLCVFSCVCVGLSVSRVSNKSKEGNRSPGVQLEAVVSKLT